MKKDIIEEQLIKIYKVIKDMPNIFKWDFIIDKRKLGNGQWIEVIWKYNYVIEPNWLELMLDNHQKEYFKSLN